jgi:hypothetical protein
MRAARRSRPGRTETPYDIDEVGANVYAYHPDHDELEKCIGNDEPHVCLSCAACRQGHIVRDPDFFAIS